MLYKVQVGLSDNIAGLHQKCPGWCFGPCPELCPRGEDLQHGGSRYMGTEEPTAPDSGGETPSD